MKTEDQLAGTRFYWGTVTGRVYSVYEGGDLMSGKWKNLYRAAGDGNQQTYTDAVDDATSKFFRVGVEWPR